MGRMFFGMPTEDQCKQAALDYKDTKDESLFKLFLHRFERLGEYICWQTKKRYSWIREVDDEDLHQTAYIGIYKAFITVPEKLDPKYLHKRVIAYVISELKSSYHYLMDAARYCKSKGLDPKDMVVVDTSFDDRYLSCTYSGNIGFNTLEDYKSFSSLKPRDKVILDLVYVEGRKTGEVAKILKISEERVRQLLKTIHSKIRRRVKRYG